MSKKMMKRSLVLGALMAFVITGSAMSVAEAGYIEGKGSVATFTDATGTADSNWRGSSGDRAVGGYEVSENGSDKDKVATALDSNLTITGGKWNMMVAGHYIDGYEDELSVNVNSTTLIIDGGQAEQVVGGSVASGAHNTKYVGAESSSLTINNGTFGGNADTNCPELFVLGGDLLKYNASDASTDGKPALIQESSIKNVTTTINGGTFDTAILGGSAAVQNYDPRCINEIKAHVGTATTNINGGEFENHAIFAGGMAHGNQTVSTVDNAVLNIKDIETDVAVYAGGVSGNGSTSMPLPYRNQPVAKVGNAIVNISNAKVGDIYGTNGNFKCEGAYTWKYFQDVSESAQVNTTLSLTNVKAGTVDVPVGSVTITASEKGITEITDLKASSEANVTMVADGTITDKYEGKAEKMYSKYFKVNGTYAADGVMEEGDIVGKTTFKVVNGEVVANSVKEEVHQGNASVAHMANIALMSWRAETNDMNKRMGELRNANGEYGVWARMVGGEDEFKNATYEYTQYQLGYDEKLSIDPSWTVGVALSYTDGESNFGQGSGENTHKGLSVYGSKLNDDGSFIDLIAKYSRLEHDLTIDGDKGDYSTNGYSVSAEYGKRFEQGKGLWIEPQVELTYGKVKSAEYKLGDKTVSQDAMESLVGRIGFSLGKDIKDGNVYARASYLYDFEGETNVAFANGASRNFEYDLGGGWWEVGVGANINLSKATYIYADIEKTFGGEVDTNWQWNLGVRYSF